MLYNNSCAHKVLQRDPGDTQKNVAAEESRMFFDD